MDHLPKLKAADQMGGKYEHSQCMPQGLVNAYCNTALNNCLDGDLQEAWRTGLVYAGNKEKLDSRGRQAARPIVVGLAICRICGRIPCTQLKDDYAKKFAAVKQLGVSVPGGLKTAWLYTDATMDRMTAEAEDTADLLNMPAASQMDCAEAFPNAWRSELFTHTAELFPEHRWGSLGLANLRTSSRGIH